MMRKPDLRADTLRELGAEVVVADLLDNLGARAAMQSAVEFAVPHAGALTRG